ncbi:MAG: LAGLIDADG family homing endonuclease, partial [Candidatus Diapherotrites archaeon]
MLGIIHGDGNMSNSRILVTDKSKKYHKVVKELFGKVFGITPNIFHDKNRNTYYSHIKRKAVYLFLVEVLEVPGGSIRKSLSLPSYVKTWNGKLKGAYLGGLLD